MVELDDKVWEKIHKDADDNRQIRIIINILIAVLITITLYFTVGTRIINLHMQRKQAELQCEIDIMNARNAVKIREIESEGMTIEEYLKWCEIRKKDAGK